MTSMPPICGAYETITSETWVITYDTIISACTKPSSATDIRVEMSAFLVRAVPNTTLTA